MSSRVCSFEIDWECDVTSDKQRSWIRDLKPGTEIEDTYVVRTKDVRQRRGGGPFLAATVGDRTFEIDLAARAGRNPLRRIRR